jgi:Flp pilus assembly secretin CpaC
LISSAVCWLISPLLTANPAARATKAAMIAAFNFFDIRRGLVHDTPASPRTKGAATMADGQSFLAGGFARMQ